MLTCSCGGDYEWYYNEPDDFTIFNKLRRKRCCSCNELIDIDSFCLDFTCYNMDDSGNEKYLANKYMCEKCGEMFFNFTSLGYCVTLGTDNMFDLLAEYQKIKNHERFQRERKVLVDRLGKRKTKRFLKRGMDIDLGVYGEEIKT